MYLPGYLWQSSNVQYVPNVQSVYIINNNNEAEKHSSLAFSYYVVLTAEDRLYPQHVIWSLSLEKEKPMATSHKSIPYVLRHPSLPL